MFFFSFFKCVFLCNLKILPHLPKSTNTEANKVASWSISCSAGDWPTGSTAANKFLCLMRWKLPRLQTFFFSIKYQGQSSVVNFTNGPEGIRGRENNGRPTYIRRNHLGLGVYGIYLHISNILYSSFKSYCAKKRQDCFEFPARRNFDEPEVCSRSLPNNAGSLFQVQSYRGVSKLPFRVRRFFYISKIMCSLQR